MAAAAEAELPVPEEVVGPTPRSQMRISISVGLTMRTNSTLVWCGKIRMHADLRADSLPRLPSHRKLRVVHHDDEVRVAGGDLDARNLKAAGKSHCPWREAGTPIPAVTCTLNPPSVFTAFTWHKRNPASVAISTSSPGRRPRSCAIHAATQRVPLPLISAAEPSALCRRMRPDFGPVHEKIRRHRRRCPCFARTTAVSTPPSRSRAPPPRSRSENRCRRREPW